MLRYLYFVYGRPTKNIILTDEQENAVIANSDFRKDSVQSDYDETRKKRSEPVIINGQKQYERDINEAKKALKRANYSCEICNEHPTFIRKMAFRIQNHII